MSRKSGKFDSSGGVRLKHKFYEKLDDFKSRVLLLKEPGFVIYRAKCSCSGGLVMLKGYGAETLTQANRLRIVHEVSCMQQVDCPFITKCFDAFQDQGWWWLVLENSAGGDLYRIANRWPDSVRNEGWLVSQVILPLLQTLAYIHGKNLIHRDIKPENILFNSEKVAKVGGFFLAHNVRECGLPYEMVGTLDYVAPEVFLANAPDSHVQHYDHKVDIWAVGVMVYDLLIGQPPFHADDPNQTVDNVISMEPVLPPVISDEALDFLAYALTKNPSERPEAADLLEHNWVLDNLDWEPDDDFEDPVPRMTSLNPDDLEHNLYDNSDLVDSFSGNWLGRAARRVIQPLSRLTQKKKPGNGLRSGQAAMPVSPGDQSQPGSLSAIFTKVADFFTHADNQDSNDGPRTKFGSLVAPEVTKLQPLTPHDHLGADAHSEISEDDPPADAKLTLKDAPPPERQPNSHVLDGNLLGQDSKSFSALAARPLGAPPSSGLDSPGHDGLEGHWRRVTSPDPHLLPSPLNSLPQAEITINHAGGNADGAAAAHQLRQGADLIAPVREQSEAATSLASENSASSDIFRVTPWRNNTSMDIPTLSAMSSIRGMDLVPPAASPRPTIVPALTLAAASNNRNHESGSASSPSQEGGVNSSRLMPRPPDRPRETRPSRAPDPAGTTSAVLPFCTPSAHQTPRSEQSAAALTSRSEVAEVLAADEQQSAEMLPMHMMMLEQIQSRPATAAVPAMVPGAASISNAYLLQQTAVAVEHLLETPGALRRTRTQGGLNGATASLAMHRGAGLVQQDVESPTIRDTNFEGFEGASQPPMRSTSRRASPMPAHEM